LEEFSEGLAPVRLNLKWGYIDKTGKIVIQPQFVDAEDFSEGFAVIGRLSSGYINKEGKTVIDRKFYLAYPFKNGLASVMVGYYRGYIDTTGKFIWGPK